MKKVSLTIFTLGLLSILFAGCCLSHDWEEATCTEPQTCSKCGETEGDALGHDWQEATCTEPKTCSKCGKTKGDALGHDWQEATCTEPKTCSKCGETEGDALGHDWQEATCTEPKTCSKCGETEGDALGHDWQEATCTEPKTCSVCGKEVGTAIGHLIDSEGVCNVCGESIGIDINHNNCTDFFSVEYEWIDTYHNDQGFPYTGCHILVTPLKEGNYENVVLSYELTITNDGYASGRACFEEGASITGEFMIDKNGNGYEEAFITAYRKDPNPALYYMRPAMHIEITSITGHYTK